MRRRIAVLLAMAVMVVAMLAAASPAMAVAVTQANGETEVTLDNGFVFVGSETNVQIGELFVNEGFLGVSEVGTDDVFAFDQEEPDASFVEAGEVTVGVFNGNVFFN